MKLNRLIPLFLVAVAISGCGSANSGGGSVADPNPPKATTQTNPTPDPKVTQAEERKLVGQWSSVGPTGLGTLEFMADGTASIRGRSNQDKTETTIRAKWVSFGGTKAFPTELELEYVSGNPGTGGTDPKGEKVRMKLHWINDNEVELTATHVIESDGVVVESGTVESQVLKRVHGN